MSAVAAPPLLRADGLTLRFGAVTALEDVSFGVGAGELLAVIGPNGAGKTSLFNLLSRIYDPTSGTLSYDGGDLCALKPHHLARAGIARTFQNLGLFPMSSVLDNVLVGRSHLMSSGAISTGLRLPFVRRQEREHRAAALEALDFVGLASIADRPVGLLPYGTRKQVEIARALAMEPTLLLLDEPVAGMSQDERGAVATLIGAIHRERKVATILVEHDMGFVMSLAERVLVLDFGRVVTLGKPAEVQANRDVIRAYLGEPMGQASDTAPTGGSA